MQIIKALDVRELIKLVFSLVEQRAYKPVKVGFL